MGIVFFEDFKQESADGQSIVDRYPGSDYFRLGDYKRGWPLFEDTALAYKYLARAPFNASSRTEIYLEFDDNGYSSGTVQTQLFVYGIRIRNSNITSIQLSVNPTYDVTVDIPISSIKSVYLDFDLKNRVYTVIINGDIKYLRATMPESWAYWINDIEGINQNYIISNWMNGSNHSSMLPNIISFIVVATDNPPGQMLDVSSLKTQERTLTYASDTNFDYTTTSYVSDVDSQIPDNESPPSVYTTDTGSIQYDSTKPADSLASNVYLGGYSENPKRYVKLSSSSEMPKQPAALPVENGDTLIEVTDVAPSLKLQFDITSANASITLNADTGSNYTIDWGDGSGKASYTGNSSHTYSTTGTYTARVYGILTSWSVQNTPYLTKVLDWGESKFFAISFQGCSNLVQVPNYIPKWVTSLDYTFRGCTSFNQSILNGEWDLSSVQTLRYFLSGADSFNQAVNIRTGASLPYLLNECSNFNKPVSIEIFSGPGIMDLGFSLNHCSLFNSPITILNKYNRAISCNLMFLSCYAFNQDISNWDTSNVTNMVQMFRNCSSFNQDLSGWDVSKVSNHSGFDQGATSWTLPRPNFPS